MNDGAWIVREAKLWPVFGWLSIWLAVVLTALVYRPLLPIDETRYVSVAWEMWQRGDFLVPHLNGVPYSHKPPLLFWLIHAGWWLFGVNAWTARLTAPVFGLLDLFLAATLGRLLWPEKSQIAALVPFVLFGTLLWMVFSTTTMFEMVLSFFVLIALVGVVHAGHGKPWLGWGLVGLGFGGGILTKGPVVFLFVLPCMLLVPWWSRGGRTVSWWRWFCGGLVSLGVGVGLALAWALPAVRAGGPDYGKAVLWTQTAGRVVKSFAHEEPLWWYLVLFPAIVFPWSLYVPVWKRVAGKPLDAGSRLCLSCVVPGLLVLSLVSGKQVYYVLPLLPAVALLMTRAVVSLNERPERKFQWPIGVVLILCGVALTGLPTMAGRVQGLAALKNMSAVWGVFPAGLGLGVVFFRPGRTESWPAVLCAACAALVMFIHLGPFRVLKPTYDVTGMAERIGQIQAHGNRVAHFGKYDDQYHFSGRLERPLEILMTPDAVRHWAEKHPDGYVVVYCKAGKGCDKDVFAGNAAYVQRYRGRWAALWQARALASSPDVLSQIQGA